jgi:NAD(P)-dependent dehydrogenase (short-subunit alcohol dehydrogenase family)
MGTAFDLTGLRILITGAARGIGETTARVCASVGAELLLVDRRATEPLAMELRETGAKAMAYVCDVTSRAEVERVAASTGPVDALVLAAGICPWDDWQEPGWDEVFEQVMAVNLHGPIHFARAWLPGMIERQSGRMVLVGSVAARIGGLVASAHYVAAKAGLHALVKWLAKRGAPHGVLVNGIAPGPIDTAMARSMHTEATRSAYHAHIPMRRYGMVEEVAGAAAFLVSDEASYITGHMLDVDGGFDAAGMMFELDAG